MLTLANVQPGGRYIVVEDTGGMLISSIFERMGGDGRILIIHDADSPPNYDILQSMNFPESSLKHCIKHLNWASIERDFDLPPLKLEAKDGGDKYRSYHEREKIEKRKELFKYIEDTRKELFDGEFDG